MRSSALRNRLKKIESGLRGMAFGGCDHPTRILMPPGSFLSAPEEVLNQDLISAAQEDPKRRCNACGLSLYRRAERPEPFELHEI
ncbi:MAG TPA: hypothetical protein PKD24_05665 [Pyrinomonadaceae bacterium]|nr:hypothetical protein [Pyrinomonadaceae bacterium]HMP65038.1 hypothetical protein [Pyrinomonadaceae bacterium]